MVDISSRKAVAAMLERIFQGELTNYQIEDFWPQKSDDRFIAELPDILWPYYDDQPEKPLRPGQFSDNGEAFLKRIILFLKSNREYEWPRWKSPVDGGSILGRLVKCLRKSSEDLENFKRYGDFDVWPFIRRADYEECAFKEPS